MLGILHLLAVLGAQLLTQLDGTGGADFHALAAGNAVVLFHPCHIGAAGQVGGIEQLRGTQGIANIDVAVADSKDLVCAVDVGDLVYKAVFFALAEDLQSFFLGNVAAAFTGLHHIVGHIAHGNTPALGIVGTALVKGLAGLAAGTGRSGILALVLIQPVRDVLHRNGLVFRFNGLFHRDHVHTDARASGRHHGGDLLQGQTAHPLEETAHFGMFLQNCIVHVGELSAAGNEHGQHPLLGAGGVLPVVFQNALEREVVQDLLQFRLGLAGELYHICHGLGLPNTHFQGHFCLLIGYKDGKPPIFRIVFVQLLKTQLYGDPVGDHFAQVQNDLSGVFFFVYPFGVVTGHIICHVQSPFQFRTSC